MPSRSKSTGKPPDPRTPQLQRPTAPREAELGVELRTTITAAVGALERVREHIRRIAMMPNRPGAQEMAAGRRPYSLAQWVIQEARSAHENDKLSEDIRVLGDVTTASQEALDEAWQREPDEYPVLPLPARLRKGVSRG